MKALRLFLFFIIALVLVTAVASFMLPTSQKIERIISINAPASEVYNQLKLLENFNKYAVWGQRDTTAKFTLSGKDGVVGTALNWAGDPNIAGDGKITLTALEENKKINHQITFTKPKQGTALSSIELNEKNGITSVSWKFELATPRPWNVFNLFNNMDKKIGKDFDEGLALLKSTIEKTEVPTKDNQTNIETTIFAGATYALIRQTVQWNDMEHFFQEHSPILSEESVKQNISAGEAVILIYNWDVKAQTADIAVACPVAAGSKYENPIIQVKEIEPSKAIATTLKGGYLDINNAYTDFKKYINDNELKEKSPALLTFTNNASDEASTSKQNLRLTILVD